MFVDVERWFLQLLHANVRKRFLLKDVDVDGIDIDVDDDGDDGVVVVVYTDAGDLARWSLYLLR